MMESQTAVPYTQGRLYGEYADSMETLLHIEDMVKEVSLYLWLNYRFPEIFCEPEKAKDARTVPGMPYFVIIGWVQ